MEIQNTNVTYYPDEILYDECNLQTNNNDEAVDTNGAGVSKNNDNDNDEYIKNILDKTSLQSINRGWNNRNEIFIISIMLSCKNYKLMHDMSATNYNNIHKIMKVVLIVFSSFLSVLTTYPDTCSNHALTIIQYCLTYIVTLFSILMNFFSYAQLSEKHRSAACEFLKIHHEIQQQMCLFKRDRFIAFRYISKIIKEYDRLVMTSPLIIPYILKKCKSDIKDSDHNISDIVREMTAIKVDDPTLQEPHIRGVVYNENNDIGILQSVQGAYNVGTDTTNTSNGSSNAVNLTRSIRGDNETNLLVINGDIQDNEIDKCNSKQIKDLRLRFFKENSTYEYLRFLQNEIG
jgi:Protein of unknown function (DUF4231)